MAALASVTRKVGQQRSDGGVEESSGLVCLLCERARWKAVAIGGRQPLFTKLTSDTYTFPPSHHPPVQTTRIVKDDQELTTPLLQSPTYTSPHTTTAKMVKAGTCVICEFLRDSLIG